MLMTSKVWSNRESKFSLSTEWPCVKYAEVPTHLFVDSIMSKQKRAKLTGLREKKKIKNQNENEIMNDKMFVYEC